MAAVLEERSETIITSYFRNSLKVKIQSIPYRAFRKMKHDGFIELVDTAKYKTLTPLLSVISQKIIDSVGFLTRQELLQNAAYTCSTRTEYLPLKRGSGLPGHNPQLLYQPDQRFVATVEDAMIIGERGLPLANDRRIIADVIAPPNILSRRAKLAVNAALLDPDVYEFYKYIMGSSVPEQTIEEAACLLPPFKNYYHWTIECLMKIRLVEKYSQQSNSYPSLLVPSSMPNWMAETVDLIDYQGEIIAWNDKAATVNKLVVPTFPDPVEEDCEWLKKRMQDAIKHGRSNNSGKRILITRRDSTIRRLVNLDDVIESLDGFGFEVHTPGHLNVSEQVELFSQADIVVGAHGAGLTNIIYSTDATVIELCASKKSATFSRLSELCGHDYTRMKFPHEHENIIVDVPRLEDIIEKKIEQI